MEEDGEEPLATAISSSQPQGGEEEAAPAGMPAEQGLAVEAALAAAGAVPPQAVEPSLHTLPTAHSTPAAAATAEAVTVAAAAAAGHGSPLGSKRSAQKAGCSPCGGGKQQRVDLLLGLSSGKRQLPAPPEQQAQQGQMGQQRRCRVCSSASPGPYASACWNRHPETKEEWLCHPCYGKALRQFRKKQAQQAQQQAGAVAAAAAAAAAEAPPQAEQLAQQAPVADEKAQQGGSVGAASVAEAADLPPPAQQQQQQQPGAQPAVPQPSLQGPRAAAVQRAQHSHSGTQTGPPAPAVGAAAEEVPTAGAGAAMTAQGAAGEQGSSQYELYRQTKQALAACGAPGVHGCVCGRGKAGMRNCLPSVRASEGRNASTPLPFPSLSLQRSYAMRTCSRCSCGCLTRCSAYTMM